MTKLDPKDIGAVDQLLSLMATASKHSFNIDQMRQDKKQQYKTEIEQQQQNLSKVFKYLTQLKVSRSEISVYTRLIEKSHTVCIELSSLLQSLKIEILNNEKGQSNNKSDKK